ncbi:MAG: polysaccharide deacetylase family protein [Verrucomicrobia bacterium]|nr:polysaccharide deacetylase family protein [Verrucomicrobiota bacterium]
MTQTHPRSASRRHASIGVTMLLCAMHAAPLGLGYWCGWPWAVAGLLGVEMILAFSTLYPHSRLFGAAIRCFPSTERSVILTIDDGPCADTEELLGILAARRVRAVFFLIGERAAQRPADVQRIRAAGHLIGNHTHTHPAYWYWSFPPWRQRREVRECQRTLSSISGLEPKLFRAPVGMRNPYCNRIAAEFALAVVGWQARGFDGVNTPLENILASIRRKLCAGAIVVLHQGLPHSPEVLRGVLLMLEKEAWSTTLPEAWLNAAPSAGTPPASC